MTPPKTVPGKILVVEDEHNVGSTLVERLQREGYEIAWARGFREALAEVQARTFDLVLLDVGLPDGDGFDLARRIRTANKSTALVFLTAQGNSDDRIRGLEAGAEDYVVKPFHFKELLLRLQNSLKRSNYLKQIEHEALGWIELGRARVNFSSFEIEAGSERAFLSQKECLLLKFLYDRRGKVVSRDEILNHVWDEGEYPTSRTVDNFILKLRRWLESDPDHPQVIRSIRGVGYALQ